MIHDLENIYHALLQRYGIETSGEMVHRFSDKGTRHSYLPVYDRILRPYHPTARILEIGVMTGGSVLLWDLWFDAADIVGIDLRTGFNEPQPWHDQFDSNVRFYFGVDSTKEPQWTEPGFDIIIDDGSHRVLDQLATFEQYWPLVNSGGIYVIEDIENAQAFDKLRQLFEDTDSVASWDSHHGYLAGRADDQMIWAIKA